jgi:hypothetical protein
MRSLVPVFILGVVLGCVLGYHVAVSRRTDQDLKDTNARAVILDKKSRADNWTVIRWTGILVLLVLAGVMGIVQSR